MSTQCTLPRCCDSTNTCDPYIAVAQKKYTDLDTKAAQLAAKAIVTKGNDLADQMIPSAVSPDEKASRVVVIRDYYSPFWSPFYSPYFFHPVYIHEPRERRNDNDAALRILVGFIATLVIGLGAVALGAALNRFQDSSKELNDLRVNQNKLTHNNSEDNNELQVLKAADEIADFEISICSRIRNSALADLLLRTSLVVSAVFTLLSAFTVISPFFMSAGIISGIAFSAVMLFKLGFENTNRRNIEEAKEIKAGIVRYNDLLAATQA